MPLPRSFFAPAFRHRRLGISLAVIVGIMVFLAVFVTAAEASLAAMTLSWNRDLASRLTVEIPAVEDEASVPQAERLRQALAILRAMPRVRRATPVPDGEAARLLRPWIDDAELLKSLPVPSLIDVERAEDGELTADDIRQQLKATLGDARVDDQAAWLGDLTRFVDGMAAFGGVLIALAGLTLALAVNLLCRAVMATEKDTIELLHLMGAEDDDIARHFAGHARRLSWPAATIGFLLALLGSGGLFYFMRRFADPALVQQAPWALLAGAVLAVPVFAVALSFWSARWSVMSALRAMP